MMLGSFMPNHLSFQRSAAPGAHAQQIAFETEVIIELSTALSILPGRLRVMSVQAQGLLVQLRVTATAPQATCEPTLLAIVQSFKQEAKNASSTLLSGSASLSASACTCAVTD